MNKLRRLLLLLCIALPGVALDRLAKHWAQTSLLDMGGRAQALPGIFGWVYAQNTGMAFSALSGSTALLSAVSVLLVACVLVWLFAAKNISRTLCTGLCLIAAGGTGNLIDRLCYGYVVDFIHLEFMHFAIFNVADILVCCGAGLSILALLLAECADRRAAK